MNVRLFVYGTLAPGDDAWDVLAPWVVGEPHPDAVPGRLYDTGRGYPGATFAPEGDATTNDDVLVYGTVVQLDPERAVAAVGALDRYEGDEYERIVVTTVAGTEVATYAWIAPLDDCRPVAGGRWNARLND